MVSLSYTRGSTGCPFIHGEDLSLVKPDASAVSAPYWCGGSGVFMNMTVSSKRRETLGWRRHCICSVTLLELGGVPAPGGPHPKGSLSQGAAILLPTVFCSNSVAGALFSVTSLPSRGPALPSGHPETSGSSPSWGVGEVCHHNSPRGHQCVGRCQEWPSPNGLPSHPPGRGKCLWQMAAFAFNYREE